MRNKRKPNGWAWTSKPFARQLFTISRMLHIYLSTALFSLLIFFCITGITLNHLSWLGDSQEKQASFNLQMTQNLENLSNLDVYPFTELLNSELGLSRPKELVIDAEMGEVTADFSLPAGYAFATWYLHDDLVEVDYQRGTVMALMNDLHKGRHTGPQWRWVLDIAAVLMLLFALTGLIILLQQIKRRMTGLWLVALGTFTPVVIYLLWVPKVYL